MTTIEHPMFGPMDLSAGSGDRSTESLVADAFGPEPTAESSPEFIDVSAELHQDMRSAIGPTLYQHNEESPPAMMAAEADFVATYAREVAKIGTAAEFTSWLSRLVGAAQRSGYRNRGLTGVATFLRMSEAMRRDQPWQSQ